MTEKERSERRRKRAALLLLPLLLLGAALCFWTLFANVSLGEAQSFIPAPLGSSALANYAEDDLPGRLRSLSISIVEAVIRDRDPEEENVGSRVEDVSDSLKSPVPTVTPKPGDPTGTPTSPPTTTPTPDLAVTGTSTATGSPSPSPFPSRTPTATKTDVPTAGPSSTPTKTPTPALPCLATPYIEVVAPLDGQRFTFADNLPGQAYAFDPDNVDPLTCNPALAVLPTPDDGKGLPGDPEVYFEIKWIDGGGTIVHTMDQNNDPYCVFTGSCDTHDLSTGLWPDPPGTATPAPINSGKHQLWGKVREDDEFVPGTWQLLSNFYIDPSIFVGDVTNAEGAGLTFTVTLDFGVPSPFTVDVSLTDVTATGGSPLVSPKDYDNVVATLNFSGITGETQQFTVATLDDAVLEGTETFNVSLNASNPSVIDSDTASGTITNNDSAVVTVDDVTELEGTGLLFTVTLDNAVEGAFDVDITFADVSATGGPDPLVTPEDYDNDLVTLNFSGSAGETQQFTVATLDDASVETTETFTVSLSATNPLVTDSDTGTGIITDNDTPPCPVFDIPSSGDDDGQEMWFNVDNTLGVSAAITRIKLSWGSGDLQWIELDGTPIWTTSLSSPIDITGGWEASTVINPSPNAQLRFRFSSSINGNYDVEIYSSALCFASDTHDGD